MILSGCALLPNGMVYYPPLGNTMHTHRHAHVVVDDTLLQADGSAAIPVGSPAWHAWLNNEQTASFCVPQRTRRVHSAPRTSAQRLVLVCLPAHRRKTALLPSAPCDRTLSVFTPKSTHITAFTPLRAPATWASSGDWVSPSLFPCFGDAHHSEHWQNRSR